MAWGALQVGALVLKETDILEDVTNANTGVRTVRLEGSETNPGTVGVQASIEAKQADIMSLIDRVLPVQFERKVSYNGFYRFTDTNTALEKWQQGPGQVRWSLAMEYLGADNAVDLESRLANVVRLNDFALSGERWHAPPAGHYGYYVGAVSPGTVVRQGEGAAITVYRSIPAGVNPRWAVPLASYLSGRVRFLSNGVERIGERLPLPAAGWELSNSLVRIRPAVAAGTTLLFAFYDGTTWREKAWDVRVGGSTLLPATHFQSVVVMRLDPEMASLRIVAAHPSTGARVLVDLALRRGSRFVEGYVQQVSANDISVQLDTLEASTLNTGYAIANAADAAGLKSVSGSARTFTLATNGGVSKTATTTLDFWVGAELTGAVAGDQAINLRDQYVGAMSEKVGVVRR